MRPSRPPDGPPDVESLMARSPAISTVELVTELRVSRSDLARFLQATHCDRLP
jgi:hypothetical protein